MAKVREAIVDILFPRRCPLCQEVVVPKDRKACYTCVSKLTPIEEPSCKKCSKAIVEQEQEYCYDCVRQKHHYERGFAIYVYEGKIKKSLLDFKFQGKQEYADFYIEQLIRHTGDKLHKLSLDLILPVPLHPRKQRVRGFNQAELLAQGIADFLKIPVYTKILCRTKYTRPQKSLDDKERLHNLEKAFEVDLESIPYPDGLMGKKILLVDDIYTTGSTIEACTRTLLRVGCAKVFFITVCIGKGY